MPDQILDFSRTPTRLRTRLHQLIVEPENGMRTSIPFEDIAVILVSHPQVTFSQSVLEELTQNGGVLVACNRKSLPVGMFLPLVAHHQVSRRIRQQASAPVPRIKKAWQQIVKAKVMAQSQLLRSLFDDDKGLSRLATTVKSGDPENIEAQAARRYWGKLFDAYSFRRKPEGEDPINIRLNFGYGVLRGIVARGICATGFHPSLGLHHHNQYNPYCLADDLMEPFRPIVDRTVYRQAEWSAMSDILTHDDKEELITPLLGRLSLDGELRTLFDVVAHLANSLVQFFAKEKEELMLPVSVEIHEEEKPF